MICPKCGLEQEVRQDCRKCGIVFSKWSALYPSLQPAEGKSEQNLLIQEFPDLGLKLRELNTRFMELEFEKAERSRLRADLKNLEQQIQQHQEQTWMRLEQIEQKLAGKLEAPESNAEAQIQQVLPNCAACENKMTRLMENLSLAINQLGDLWEKANHNSKMTADLQDQVAALQKELSEIKPMLCLLQQTPKNEEPQTIEEDDIRAIRRDLDELGQFISSQIRK